MNFTEIAKNRQSCRSYDPAREVEEEKLQAILETARISPSACNSQPYHITVCRGETAAAVTKACQGMGMNKFASDAKVMIVLSEEPYNKSAAVGAKVKNTTSVPLILAFSALISPQRPPRRVLAPASSAGWTATKLWISAIWTGMSVWSWPWAMPRKMTSFAPKSARICVRWSHKCDHKKQAASLSMPPVFILLLRPFSAMISFRIWGRSSFLSYPYAVHSIRF